MLVAELVRAVLQYFLYADDVRYFTSAIGSRFAITGGYFVSELEFLDMAINVRKSACMRFGPRYKIFVLILLYLVILSNGIHRSDILA